MSWLPWRGPNPVRWTLALALCVVAAFAAGFPSEWRDVTGRPAEWWNASVPPLATWAALAALAVALPLWPLRRKEPFVWPWRGPDPLRNTLASVMTLSAIAAVLLELATLERRALHGTTGRVPGVWMLVWATLMFASAVVSTRRRGWAWLWACNAAVYWWLFLN